MQNAVKNKKNNDIEDLWGKILPSGVIEAFLERQTIAQASPEPHPSVIDVLNELESHLPILKHLESQL